MLTTERKSLVIPVTLSDSEYAEKWISIQYKRKAIGGKAKTLYTDKDEEVRSKSEVIIANALNARKIPYRYEFPIILKRNNAICDSPREKLFYYDSEDMCTLHPDFYCLNLRTRQEFLWEHFGMMDDSEYAARAAEKIILFQENGYLPGKNMIITVETTTHPLSSKLVKKIIENYLL